MKHVKLFEEFGDKGFYLGREIWFKIKKDKYGNGYYEQSIIHDNISKIVDGKIITSDGYVFDEDTLMLVDNDYFDKFPYDKVRLHKTITEYK